MGTKLGSGHDGGKSGGTNFDIRLDQKQGIGRGGRDDAGGKQRIRN